MLEFVNAARSYENEDRSLERYTTNLFYCTRHKAEEKTFFLVNTASSYCLFYLLSGSVRVENEVGEKGDAILFSKLSNYTLRVGEGSSWLYIMFEYSHGLSMLFHQGYRLLHTSANMREMIEGLYFTERDRLTLPGVREAMLLVILNEANRVIRSESKSISLHASACEWIERNATQSITVQDVSDALGCTREHLNRVFRMASGQSVGSFIAKSRIWEIEQLCRGSRFSTAEIAKRLDFSSVELLCKYFRYHKGISLSQYRMMHQ